MSDINENTNAQSGCKFLEREIVQGIVHEFCQNHEMKKINKCPAGKKLVCIGNKCGNASFDNT